MLPVPRWPARLPMRRFAMAPSRAVGQDPLRVRGYGLPSDRPAVEIDTREGFR